ncbi:MAG: F0F1 ATP synthase subunit A [Fusobacteria bacterium]|nr:F0F1 ATP synthase subunit A [Fusobacteriota bacterium]
MPNIMGFFHPTDLVPGPPIVFQIHLSFFHHQLLIPISKTVTVTWFCMMLMIVFGIWVNYRLELKPTRAAQVLGETVYAFIEMMASGLGAWKNHFFSFVGALFIFLGIANMVMILPIPWIDKVNGHFFVNPALICPTANINTTLGLALISFFLMIGYGIRAHGFGYFKELIDPTPLMLPLHLLSEVTKPLNIAMRLFGNMIADSVIIGILYMFTSKVFGLFVILIPFHIFFEGFLGIIQSMVFTMLSLSYIAMAIGKETPLSVIRRKVLKKQGKSVSH